MAQRIRLTTVVLGTITLTACSAVDVSSKDGGEMVTQPGIPFYVKVPVLNHETRRVYHDLELQIELADDRSSDAQKVSLPTSGPIRIDGAASSQKRLRDELTRLDAGLRGTTFVEAEKKVSHALAMFAPPSFVRVTEPDVTSNTWALQMITGPKVYYIKNRVPLIGTATADFEFDSQGTLTKSNTTVTDDTAKTVLGLFPITAELEKKWAITSAQGANAAKPTVSMTVKIVSVDTVYLLRRVEELPSGSSVSAYSKPGPEAAPLTLAEARDGSTGVQLVSTTEVRGDDKTKDSSKASNAYELTGKIVPPTPASSPLPASNSDVFPGTLQ